MRTISRGGTQQPNTEKRNEGNSSADGSIPAPKWVMRRGWSTSLRTWRSTFAAFPTPTLNPYVVMFRVPAQLLSVSHDEVSIVVLNGGTKSDAQTDCSRSSRLPREFISTVQRLQMSFRLLRTMALKFNTQPLGLQTVEGGVSP